MAQNEAIEDKPVTDEAAEALELAEAICNDSITVNHWVFRYNRNKHNYMADHVDVIMTESIHDDTVMKLLGNGFMIHNGTLEKEGLHLVFRKQKDR